MRKPEIPPPSSPAFNERVREMLQVLTGRRGERIELLPTNPTNEQIAAKINELLSLLQD